ncbi:MAG TPA: Re/Si-specific NAD(P)(+) transhydrogenase subunit alpha [Acidimicrobiia bacterium]|nr:Re/Si-specific NAD(P)(+) transhydrogenase subunit alpha [Acidimicrobiia bacterium]
MRIAIPKESAGEARVAITPPVVVRLIEQRHEVAVESGAGAAAGFDDEQFRSAGAYVSSDPVTGADVVLIVGPPTSGMIERMPRGAVLIGFLDPFATAPTINAMVEQQISSFAMEAIPRTTLAQTMDALSSQATAAGYQAVLIAATTSPRLFPMLVTAAGTIPPVKLLVLGAGVAGLQAIATAKRLGAVVSAYDIRPEVRQQIESLGAKFVAAPVDESAAAATGYAKEVADETQRRQQDALSPYVADSDVVITTAQIPGSPAPLLVSTEMVERMRPGSVIVDVAAPTGGNCEPTRPGETIVLNGVTIVGQVDLASQVAMDASHMYARNVASLLARMTDEHGALTLDFDDEIISEACITHQGKVNHPVVRRRLTQEDVQ